MSLLLMHVFQCVKWRLGTWLFIIGPLVEHSMNRIDMLFSINGLLILKDPLPTSHPFAGHRDKM